MKLVEFFKLKDIEIKNIELIKQAFIHSSYVNEHKYTVIQDNERLEFMGDAVLQLWTSEHLYKLEPQLAEGQMTTLRAKLVNETSLANCARTLGLSPLLMLGQGEEKTGGRNRDSILADTFEAMLGALYLDSGMKAVDCILDEVMLPFILNHETLVFHDYKTKLQEYIQADNRKTVVYEVVHTEGPSNNPSFEVVVKVDDIVLGKGIGNSKKKAEQNAAKDAFDKMVR